MTRSTLTRLGLAMALTVSASTAVAAQESAEPAPPEGTTWHLTAYAADGMAPVPFWIETTLVLDDGSASGSTGCNTFNGTYALDGSSLTFDETFALTRAACVDEAASQVEAGYLAALPQVTSWSIEADVLRLADGDSDLLFTFEEPVIALTRSAMADIIGRLDEQQAELARAGERVDDIRIGALRDRIKELEASVAKLQAQAAASSSKFSDAEKVLLKAIPQPVKRTCQPLRSGLPAGTAAAVACDGSSAAVADQAYYLTEWRDAVATLRSVASSKGVPNRNPRCFAQRAGWINYGTNLGAEACWNENGQGNYRLVTMATSCKQLDVAGTRLKQPAIYLAMEGVNDRMEPLRAAGLAYTDAGWLIMNFEAGGYIPAGNQPNSPGCKARLAQAGGL